MTGAEKALEERLANRAARRAAREAERLTLYPVPCCGPMKQQLDEANIFDVLANVPFSTTPAPRTIWAQSDGGHGGMVALQYCPFCGSRFVWERKI